LKRSYAYSDSQNDLPMLTAVGHPVAVNPDKILTRYAKAADWPIYDFKKRELKANRE
jgi:phosphoserine phosphatase